MNTPSSSMPEHQDIWELLPWLVNGRLSEADSRRAETHLRVCEECRGEYRAQRQIHHVIAADTAVEQLPMAGLNRLRQRIETAASAGVVDPPSDRSSPAFRRHLRSAAVAAAVLALSVALGIPTAIHLQAKRHGATSPYYTVTAPAAQQPGAAIRAVFAPTITLSELQALLDDAHLRIVDGPTEAGVYSLAMTAPQSIDWSLRELREHGTVRFAEVIGPAAPAAPPP